MKYRLKKSYPNCPVTVGTVIIQDNPNDWVTADEIELGLKDIDVTEFPEFWELVLEKEYEILSFKGKLSTNNRHLFILNNNGTYDYANYSAHTLETLSSGNSTVIHSIKRLSDGEVFTIGDSVKFKNWSTYYKIISFEIYNNSLGFELKGTQSTAKYTNWKNFIKEKTPLFITEDGVGVFEGHVLYRVHSQLLIPVDNNYTKRGIKANFVPYDNLKYFSTKEAAEEYILMNKPCLSVKDIVDELSTYQRGVNNLKQLVKSKL